MNTKTCGSCIHWGDEDEARAAQPIRTCQAIRHRDQPRSFDSEETGLVLDAEVVAGTRDGSDYRSALISREDFGCILHREEMP